MAAPSSAGYRIVLMSFLAGGIGLIAGLVAYILYKLIALFTNLFFFHEATTILRSVGGNHLGAWVIAVPVAGGLIVGIMLIGRTIMLSSPRMTGR